MEVLVVMPCYNVVDTLLSTLESVYAQTYKQFTLVCCDDKSTDNTLQLLHIYKDKYMYDYIILQNDINMGTGQTVNKCINEMNINEMNTYKYITWISADNLLKPNFVEKHVHKLKEGHAITYSGFEIIDVNHMMLETSYPNGDLLHLRTHYKLSPSFFFTLQLYLKVGGFHSLPGEDYLFAVECILHGAKFGYMNDILVSYLKHDNSVSGRLENGTIPHKICTPIAVEKAQYIQYSNGDNIYQ
jgi:glycosyltransferase involved in cell wall biosynthesis